jgi:hypothetical protein
MTYKSDVAFVAGSGLVAPSAAACAARLSAPLISPSCGSSSTGPLLVTLSSMDPNVSLSYTLSGSAASVYSGPFLLTTPGQTILVATAAREGALPSSPLSCSYFVSLTNSSGVFAKAVAPLSSEFREG